ncbi:MAG TPA: hypothetical protein VHX43_03965 [Xanthobacteraceae bacterium]|jgi:hypothetical protein|nr:hypothetical protein [Xanthobacteraceae bacterium]
MAKSFYVVAAVLRRGRQPPILTLGGVFGKSPPGGMVVPWRLGIGA